jgi:WD40 repeat protein
MLRRCRSTPSRLFLVAMVTFAVVLQVPVKEGAAQQKPAVEQADDPPALPFSGRMLRHGLFPRSPDSTGSRWQVESRRPRGWIPTLSWHSEGKLLAVAESSGCVRIYHTDPWQLVNVLYCNGRVEEVAYSPDGDWLATVSDEKPNYGGGTTLRIWKADGTPVAEKSISFGMSSNIAWSPDGKRLATAGYYRSVLVFDRAAKQMKSLDGHPDTIRRVAWSPAGSDIASFSRDGHLRIWHLSRAARVVDDGLPRPPVPGKRPALAVSFTVVEGVKAAGISWMPDGTTLACAEASGRIFLRHEDGSIDEIAEHAGGVTGLAPHRDGKRLAVCSGGAIQLYDVASHEGRTLEGTQPARRLAWSPREDRLATTDGNSVMVLDVKSGRRSVVSSTYSSSIISRPINWSPDGKQFAYASRNPWLRIWNADGSGAARCWETESQRLWHVSWNSNSGLLATDGFGDVVRLWKPDGEQVAAFENFRSGNTHPRWSPDGNTLAIAGSDGSCRFASERGRVLSLHQGADRRLHKFAWSPQSDLLAMAPYGDMASVSLLNTQGKVVNKMAANLAGVRGMDWHPLGRRLALIDNEGNVRTWDTAGAKSEVIGKHEKSGAAVAWSPSGEWLASSSVDVKIYSGDGKLLATIEQDANALLGNLAWHPQSAWIAAQVHQQMVRLWKPSGEEGPTLYGNGLAQQSMAWSSDGKQILCATNDGRVIAWDPATGATLWVGFELNDGESGVVDADGVLRTDDVEAFDGQFVFVHYVDGKTVLKTAKSHVAGGR